MLRKCDGCQKESNETDQMTCLSAHVSLEDYGASYDDQGCFDDNFFCPN